MKKIIAILLIGILSSSLLHAQTKTKAGAVTCPSIELVGPYSASKSGEIITFKLMIDGSLGNPKNYKIKWFVDKPNAKETKIISGQGTTTLKLIDNGKANHILNVSVELDAGKNCNVISAQESASVITEPVCVLIYSFELLKDDELTGRLDGFIFSLQDAGSQAQGYIVNYGSAKEVERREKLMKSHFMKRNFDLTKIVFIGGGVEPKIRTRLWLVPFGADASNID